MTPTFKCFQSRQSQRCVCVDHYWRHRQMSGSSLNDEQPHGNARTETNTDARRRTTRRSGGGGSLGGRTDGRAGQPSRSSNIWSRHAGPHRSRCRRVCLSLRLTPSRAAAAPPSLSFSISLSRLPPILLPVLPPDQAIERRAKPLPLSGVGANESCA